MAKSLELLSEIHNIVCIHLFVEEDAYFKRCEPNRIRDAIGVSASGGNLRYPALYVVLDMRSGSNPTYSK